MFSLVLSYRAFPLGSRVSLVFAHHPHLLACPGLVDHSCFLVCSLVYRLEFLFVNLTFVPVSRFSPLFVPCFNQALRGV